MRTDSISAQSFGTLIYGETINANILSKKSSRAVNMELQAITKYIKDEKLDSLKNVDVILEHKRKGGFYGVISSKKQGIPVNPDYTCHVNDLKASMFNFKNWAMGWEKAFSPEQTDSWHKTISFIRNSLV